MSNPYYVPKYYFNNNKLHNNYINKFNYNNNNYNFTINNKFNNNIIINNNTYNIIEKDQNNQKQEIIELKESDSDSDDEKEKEKNANKVKEKNNSNNNNKLSNNTSKNIINNNEASYDDEDSFSFLSGNINNSFFKLNTTISNPNNSYNSYTHIPNNRNRNTNIYNRTNNLYNFDEINHNKKSIYDINVINNKNDDTQINMTFEECLGRVKNNLRKVFSKNVENKENIFENVKFREKTKNNKNIKLIFQYHDIIKELYDNKIETKIVVKKCEINKLIDQFISNIKKLGIKRHIVVKDYKNYIFIIGFEMMINIKDKQAKEFIIKKQTETYKGNHLVKTQDDNCYIMEINNQKNTKQIYNTINSVSISLFMLFQNMNKYAVFK